MKLARHLSDVFLDNGINPIFLIGLFESILLAAASQLRIKRMRYLNGIGFTCF